MAESNNVKESSTMIDKLNMEVARIFASCDII